MSDTNPTAVPKPLTYHDLRTMAECAGGYRGEPVWMIVDSRGWRMSEREPDGGELEPGAVVLRCQNPDASHRRVGHAAIGPAQSRPGITPPIVDLLDLDNTKGVIGAEVRSADAVFWSASAVEKFLVPYYASLAGNQADRHVADLLDVLDELRDPRRSASPNDEEAFGLAHIPKSEYVQLGGVNVLVAGPKGARAVSVSDWVAERRRKP
jgi:hypothetical protein